MPVGILVPALTKMCMHITMPVGIIDERNKDKNMTKLSTWTLRKEYDEFRKTLYHDTDKKYVTHNCTLHKYFECIGKFPLNLYFVQQLLKTCRETEVTRIYWALDKFGLTLNAAGAEYRIHDETR